jgi:iron(III) transport system ATP-binding protein
VSVSVRVTHRLSAAFSLSLDLSLEAPRTAFVGASGAGKSSTLLIIAGLLQPHEGTVRGFGEVWSDTSSGVFRPPNARGIAYVPQDGGLFPHLSVAENVAYPLTESSRAKRLRVAELLGDVGLAALAHTNTRPATLSGGEIARVALARAMARPARLALLDEPFAALDAETRRAMVDRVAAWIEGSGSQAILVTHDRGDADRLGARAITFAGGRVVDARDPADPAHP